MQQDGSDNPDQPTVQGHGSQHSDTDITLQLPRTQSDHDIQALLQQGLVVDTDPGNQFELFAGPQNQPGSPATAAAFEPPEDPLTAGTPPAPGLQPHDQLHPIWAPQLQQQQHLYHHTDTAAAAAATAGQGASSSSSVCPQQQQATAAAAAAGTAQQQHDTDLMTCERYSELVKKDDRPCPARLNNRGTLGRDYTGQAAFTDNSGESSSRDGSAKKKRKVNNRPNMIAAGRAATGQASKAAGVAAGSSQQRNRQPAGDMGRQNSLLAIGRNVKALLGRRGQELWNTLCTLYANKSGGLNQAGVKAFLHLVLGPEKVDGQYSWRWPATAEQGHAGIVRFLGRWLSILTGTFIHPAEVNDCYVSERPSEETPEGQPKKRKRSSKTIASEQWLREHSLAPWTWSFPSPIGPVNDGADPPPPPETLSQADIYAIDDAALKAVRERGQAADAARLEAALGKLRARPQAVIQKELNKVVKRRHTLQQAVISKAVVAAADEVLQQQPAAAAEPGNNQEDSAAVAAAATPPLQQTAEQTALEPPAAAAVDAEQDIQEGQQQRSAAGDAGGQSTHADQVQPSAEAVHDGTGAAAAAGAAQPSGPAAAQDTDAAAAAPTRRSGRTKKRNTKYGDYNPDWYH